MKSKLIAINLSLVWGLEKGAKVAFVLSVEI